MPVPREWKDKYKGKRCFVLGTGPSLKGQDLSLLDDEITIGCNSIFRAMTPTFLCISDPSIVVSLWNDLAKLKGKCELVVSVPPCKPVPGAHSVLLDKSALVQNTGYIHGDLAMTWWGRTVIIDLCLPLAYHLGCHTAILLGCDCESTGHFYKDQTHGRHAGNWPLVFAQYKQMKKIFESKERQIHNATAGGKLEVFKRVKYEELFREDQSQQPD